MLTPSVQTVNYLPVNTRGRSDCLALYPVANEV